MEPEPDPPDFQSIFQELPMSSSSANIGEALSVPLAPDPLFQMDDTSQSPTPFSVRSVNKELVLSSLKKSVLDSDEAAMRSTFDNIYSQTEAAYRPLGLGFSKKFHPISILPVSKSHSGRRTVFKEFNIMPPQMLSSLVNLEKLRHPYVPLAPSKDFHKPSILVMSKKNSEHRTAIVRLKCIPTYLYQLGTVDKVPWRPKIKYPIPCLDFPSFVFMINDYISALSPARIKSRMGTSEGLDATTSRLMKSFIREWGLIYKSEGLSAPGSREESRDQHVRVCQVRQLCLGNKDDNVGDCHRMMSSDVCN